MNNFRIKSNYTGNFYDINIYIPENNESEKLPLLLVLDGGNNFEVVKSCIKQQSLISHKTGIKSAIVVGIAHREFEKKEKRFLDFTGPAEKYILPKETKFNIPETLGGASKFNDFLEKELFGILEADLNFDKENMTIIGHSLSGYYVLWNLLKGSNLYKNIISFSPSVWWNDYELLTLENLKDNNRNIFICTGEKEGYMVPGAEKIYNKIKSFNTSTEVFITPDEHHGSVFISSISRALRYIFSK